MNKVDYRILEEVMNCSRRFSQLVLSSFVVQAYVSLKSTFIENILEKATRYIL